MLTILPAASGPFFSLNNTDFVVTIGFLIFIGILLYYRLPSMVTAQLDKRADSIRKELDDARQLREEASELLADYERRKKEVSGHAASIVSAAKADAEASLEQAKADIEKTMERRLAAADEQIASAEEAAVRNVRERAASVAVAAAAEVLSAKLDDEHAAKLTDRAIEEVRGRLH